jgi:hypothetical protein
VVDAVGGDAPVVGEQDRRQQDQRGHQDAEAGVAEERTVLAVPHAR